MRNIGASEGVVLINDLVTPPGNLTPRVNSNYPLHPTQQEEAEAEGGRGRNMTRTLVTPS